jgi:hypothetical protein
MNYKDRIIILGHPRSGTGYAAWVARQYGLHIGHERLRADGISSWFWGIKDKSPPFGRGYVECPDGYKDLVIYSLRNPEDVIMSTYYTENRTKKYREKHLNHDLSGIQGAAYSYLKWFKECEKNWEGIQKIKMEDMPTFFENYTNSKINFEIKIINSRSYPRDKSVLKDIDEELLRQCWDVYNQA